MNSTPRSWTARRWRPARCLRVRRVRNPVRAARAVMERPTRAARRRGRGRFRARSGLAMVRERLFHHQRRVAGAWASMKHARARRHASRMATEAEKHGTVGAVALDSNGHLAAATSTGGFNNKPAGRVGDSADHRRRHLRARTASAPSPAPARAKSSSATSSPTISRRGCPMPASTLEQATDALVLRHADRRTGSAPGSWRSTRPAAILRRSTPSACIAAGSRRRASSRSRTHQDDASRRERDRDERTDPDLGRRRDRRHARRLLGARRRAGAAGRYRGRARARPAARRASRSPARSRSSEVDPGRRAGRAHAARTGASCSP